MPDAPQLVSSPPAPVDISYRFPETRTPPPPHWTLPPFEIRTDKLPPLPRLPLEVGGTPFKHKSWLTQYMGEEATGARVEQASQKRGEWVGDITLSNFCASFLHDHPVRPESGICTIMRGRLISNLVWSIVGRAYRLDQDLLLGPEAEKNGTREAQKIIADVFESYIGELWLVVLRSKFTSPYTQPFLAFMTAFFSSDVFPWVDGHLQAEQDRVLEARRTTRPVKSSKKRKRLEERAKIFGGDSYRN